MLTRELKKGDFVHLINGWQAKVLSGIRTNLPVCEVFGDYTEIGSVYAHDIVAKLTEKDGEIECRIEYTESQLKMRKEVEEFFNRKGKDSCN
jgi:hypothetical protein